MGEEETFTVLRTRQRIAIIRGQLALTHLDRPVNKIPLTTCTFVFLVSLRTLGVNMVAQANRVVLHYVTRYYTKL